MPPDLIDPPIPLRARMPAFYYLRIILGLPLPTVYLLIDQWNNESHALLIGIVVFTLIFALLYTNMISLELAVDKQGIIYSRLFQKGRMIPFQQITSAILFDDGVGAHNLIRKSWRLQIKTKDGTKYNFSSMNVNFSVEQLQKIQSLIRHQVPGVEVEYYKFQWVVKVYNLMVYFLLYPIAFLSVCGAIYTAWKMPEVLSRHYYDSSGHEISWYQYFR